MPLSLMPAVHTVSVMVPRAAAKKEKMMWETLREAIDEEMEADPTVLVMGAGPLFNATTRSTQSWKFNALFSLDRNPSPHLSMADSLIPCQGAGKGRLVPALRVLEYQRAHLMTESPPYMVNASITS